MSLKAPFGERTVASTECAAWLDEGSCEANDWRMNYGETLAYWYLRLNGFFPLRNFVMHMPHERRQRSDCDILALRLPKVSEDIGGQADDWDRARFESWRLSLDVPIVMIVQVKTGTEGEPGEAFASKRLVQGIRRAGLWDFEAIEKIAKDLEGVPLLQAGGPFVAKLLIASRPIESTTYLSMKLDDATRFIEGRFKRYSEQKEKDRLFFNDELIQFLAHKAGLQIESKGTD